MGRRRKAAKTSGQASPLTDFQDLEYCKQNRSQAAKLLDISVRTLRNKLKEYGVSEP